MIMEQKYEGACPAGMEPGDMTGADGRVIHRARLRNVIRELTSK